MPPLEAGALNPGGYLTMKMRLIVAGGLLLALSGCATYDYVGSGGGDGYYHGAPSTQYRYPAGYPGAYGYPSYPYGYGSGYYGYGGYGYGGYGYPVYRPVPNHRPPHNGHRPPNHTRPPNQGQRPPTRPPGNNGGSPWRNLDSVTRPRPQPGNNRPAPSQQQSRPPQSRPSPPPRPAASPRPSGSPWRNMNRATERKVER